MIGSGNFYREMTAQEAAELLVMAESRVLSETADPHFAVSILKTIEFAVEQRRQRGFETRPDETEVRGLVGAVVGLDDVEHAEDFAQFTVGYLQTNAAAIDHARSQSEATR